MTNTAKYCPDCIRKLSLAPVKTGREKEFWDARRLVEGTILNDQRFPQTEAGSCDKCGLMTVLTYYRKPD